MTMKNFFKNKSSIMPVTVICALLTVLCAVSLYYMQYDLTATNWIYVFVYATLLISSLTAMFHLKAVKDKNKLLLAVGLVVLNAVNLTGSLIFAISETNYFTIISAAATAVFAVFALSYTDSVATGKSFNKSKIYNIAIPVLFVIPAILSFVIKSQINNMLAVMYAEAAVLFVAGVILAIMSIIKGNKGTFIFVYGAFSLAMLASDILNLFGTSMFQNFLHGFVCLMLAFIVPALISDEKTTPSKKKNNRK